MNPIYQQRVERFKASRKIAVAGYSSGSAAVGNGIYDRLKKAGYEVFAVNPKADAITDVPCYPNLAAIPEKPDAVVICTPPQATMSVLEECVNLNISLAWIHRSVDKGSYVEGAEEYAQKHGVELIPTGCPMMFVKPDFVHKCFKWVMNWRGKLEAKGEPLTTA